MIKSLPSLKVIVLFICLYYKLVSFRGLFKLRPRPDWSLLGVKFKISDEHPRPFYMGVPPRVWNASGGHLGYLDENKLRIGVSNWAFLMEYFLQAS